MQLGNKEINIKKMQKDSHASKTILRLTLWICKYATQLVVTMDTATMDIVARNSGIKTCIWIQVETSWLSNPWIAPCKEHNYYLPVLR